MIPGTQVTLSATVTEGEASTIGRHQTAGTLVALDPIHALTPSFTAPAVDSGETLEFEVTAEAGDATDSVLVEIWVANQDPNNGTLLGNFSAKPGWACDHDPVASPDLTTEDLGNVTEHYTNGIPAHATGTFLNQGNPNTIHSVFQTRHVPKVPERTDTAQSFRNDGVWRYEAITPMKPATTRVAGPASGASSGAVRQERYPPARDFHRKFPAGSTAHP